ncbi:MAG: SelT/SelW/SelH family protein [Cytophagales bacterium]|nr:SelT/SelW/SelH family protein [Cytophagales bacterium]
MKNNISIEYCPKCGWLIRAAWMAQELLTTFDTEISQVALIPSATGGKFEVKVNEKVVFDRKSEGQFVEIKVLKQIIRDVVAPDKNLGHSDRH